MSKALPIAVLAGGIHWHQPVDAMAAIDTVSDADLLEVAILGDLPDFDLPGSDSMTP